MKMPRSLWAAPLLALLAAAGVGRCSSRSSDTAIYEQAEPGAEDIRGPDDYDEDDDEESEESDAMAMDAEENGVGGVSFRNYANRSLALYFVEPAWCVTERPSPCVQDSIQLGSLPVLVPR